MKGLYPGPATAPGWNLASGKPFGPAQRSGWAEVRRALEVDDSLAEPVLDRSGRVEGHRLRAPGAADRDMASCVRGGWGVW